MTTGIGLSSAKKVGDVKDSKKVEVKLIFLDMDGVMNDTKTLEEAAKDYKPELHWDRMIGYEFIVRLNSLVEASGAKVVLSSDWRHYFPNLTPFIDLMNRRGFVGQVIGSTPSLDERWMEISEFMDQLVEAGETVDSFVILDDYKDMGRLLPFLVCTEKEHGLQDEHVEQALEILSKVHS